MCGGECVRSFIALDIREPGNCQALGPYIVTSVQRLPYSALVGCGSGPVPDTRRFRLVPTQRSTAARTDVSDVDVTARSYRDSFGCFPLSLDLIVARFIGIE